ncbi:RAB6A-GEF complex partner protein 2-like [Acropora muricata]|uniref:RAB6A-GEF complex partner protein 2-like n=2 Tax=Acropora TaxID=6127 RepID=UPI0034E55D79
MIEVKARLLRGSVFFAGECIECEITFTNTASVKKETDNQTCRHALDSECSNKNYEMDRLAWASVQIHCQCSVNESWVKLPPRIERSSENLTSDSNSASCTSFIPSRGEEGRCVISTTPKILFCDLELAPGESRNYFYSDTVPTNGTPSYRGHAVKYSYKITVGTSRVQGDSKMLRLPIRILVIQGVDEIENFLCKQENLHNPFLENSSPRISFLDVAVDILMTITSRRNSHVYNIVSERGSVGQFCLFKSAYRIGEEIVGSFDFSNSLIICLKFSVVLQSEEQIPEDLCNSSKHSSGVTYSSFTSVSEHCLHTKKTHLVLPIPVTVCPEFVSDIVCLKWRLHFEFILASSPLPAGASPVQLTSSHTDVATWQGPPDIEVETVTWDLPIKILPTNPLNASSISTTRTSNAIVF